MLKFIIVLLSVLSLNTLAYDKVFTNHQEFTPEQNSQFANTSNFLIKKKACLLAYDYKSNDIKRYNYDKNSGLYNRVYCIADRVLYPGTSRESDACTLGVYEHTTDNYDIVLISNKECLKGGLEDLSNGKFRSPYAFNGMMTIEKNMFPPVSDPNKHIAFIMYSENAKTTNFFNDILNRFKLKQAKEIEEKKKEAEKFQQELKEKQAEEKKNDDKVKAKKKKMESMYE